MNSSASVILPPLAPKKSPFVDPFGRDPLRDELFGQAYLEAYARELAEASEWSRTFPAKPIFDRLREDDRYLHYAHAGICEASREQEVLTPDAEWLLDNFFVVEDVLREVKADLPADYYAELPRLSVGSTAGYPRILAMALGLIAHSDSSLNEHQIREFVRVYQSVRPLTIGELWAIPTMLRLGLIENLRRLAEQMTTAREDREYAAKWVAEQVAGGELRPPARQSDPALVGILQGLRDHGAAAQPIVNWIENWLAENQLNPSVLLRREHSRQAANQVSVGNCITSLRLLNALDWNDFVEQTSLVEAELRLDPSKTYMRQDFATRDRCRHEIERLARGSGLSEVDVAKRVVQTAADATTDRHRLVAYHLIDHGRKQIARAINYKRDWKDFKRDLFRDHPAFVYFGLLFGTLAIVLAALVVSLGVRSVGGVIAVLVIAALPASEIAIGLVNYLITKIVPPTVLPKLDFRHGIPDGIGAFVVMPSMLTRADSADHLLERLELHYLANPDPQLRFALLTDFADAPDEEMPLDEEFVQAAIDGVRRLNERYAPGGEAVFFVFHRKRLWNPSENKWMGWERKRGKLQEFNKLLRGATDTSYHWKSGPITDAGRYRYVITLDADTNLPRETARRLICTLAHPLNQARLNAERTKVVEGFGILQPRVSFLFQTGRRSLFAKMLASSGGIDPYQTAVSDVYQDLFGAGSFIGKGIYDVDAFEAVTEPAFPDNRILSHDLIESNFARCGLVTDIELLDDFPARYHAYAKRDERWIRGDWQLLPWLLPTTPARGRDRQPTRRRNVLGLIQRWKIVDNLRRSLVGPMLVVALAAGWTILPGRAWVWTLFAVAVVGTPVVIQLLQFIHGVLVGKPRAAFGGLRASLPGTAGQAGMWASFIVDLAWHAARGIGTTLGRLFFTQRHLLEWETAAAAEQRLGADLRSFYRSMWVSTAIAAVILIAVGAVHPAALPQAAPLLAAWLSAPLVAWWVSQPLKFPERVLTDDDRRSLRRLARKTWGFFEVFVGPQDHWLPPDNFQEDPKGEIAHRTSPTNMGLLLLSTLAAHDFGYVSLKRMVERLGLTLDTLERLEKFRGHILNWFDTQSLVPLHPSYVSVVDSGNLMACLYALKHGLMEKLDEPVFGRQVVTGAIDTLQLAEESLDRLELSGMRHEPLASHYRNLRGLFTTPPVDLPGWAHWCEQCVAESVAAVALAEKLSVHDAGGQLNRWTVALHAQLSDWQDELKVLAPWLPLWDQLTPEWRDRLASLRSVGEWAEHLPQWTKEANGANPQLAQALAASNAIHVASLLASHAERSEALARGMDFRFLYNPDRNLFSIGYNLSVGRLDNAHYDLLASECRITSFLAVARGEVPRKHWFQLGRPMTEAAGRQGLLSWGGTMFEYLMPRLLLPSFPNTLLDLAEHTAVAKQEEFGDKNSVPWGVSESGFYLLDVLQTYQYQSFGTPGLGLKRGLNQDVVIAPYATMMAVVIDPHAARINLDRIRAEGGEGPFGCYEAIDYTRRRLPLDKKSLVVKQYMAHHQGMGFIALANCLLPRTMPQRLRAEPMVRANELLLQERVPTDAPVVIPPEDDESARRVALAVQMPVSRRMTTADTPSPRAHVLSNGQYTIMMTNSGAGFSRCRTLDVTRWRADRTRDDTGQFIYIRNPATGEYWSATHHPVGKTPSRYEVTFSIDKVDYRRVDGPIESHLEVTVSPEANVEARRLTLTNHGSEPVELDVTSYAEIAMLEHAADVAHPAFGKLFLETEWVPAQRALLCRRRPRKATQEPVWAVHTIATEGKPLAHPTFETDRFKFLGRRRDASRPWAMEKGVELSGSTGAVLDPVFALRQRVRIEPGASAGVAFTTAVADTREAALAFADQFNAFHSVLRVFDLAWAQSRVELRDLNVTVEESHLFQRLAGLVLFPTAQMRGDLSLIRANQQGQPGLWKFGISGDIPIVLVRVKEPDEMSLVRQLVAAHTFWRINGFTADLVILNEHGDVYLDGVNDQIMQMVRTSDANAYFDKPGGIFVRKADQFGTEDRQLLHACARVVLLGELGSLADQLDLPERVPPVPPKHKPTEQRPPRTVEQVHHRPDLVLHNGVGGFTQDGHEYVITYYPNEAGTPAPWSNVVANEFFGFLVTEAGGGFTWQGNSQSNRLTPWSNDPVSDDVGEAFYIRDEATGEYWSVTGLPTPAPSQVRARHGQGYSAFERIHTGLEQELRMSVPAHDPVKLIRLKITNRSGRPRKLSATFFAELVLGTEREATAQHVWTEVDQQSGTLLAFNAYNPDFGSYVAFADVSLRPRTVTGDRTEFIGRNGSAAAPAALAREELSNRTGVALDPCAAIHAKFDLAPDEQKEIVFILGQAPDREKALRLAGHYRDVGRAEQAFRDAVAQWDTFLGALTVRTPNRSLDMLVNRWLPYQVLACRFWGRSAFYQSGGAFGFRDQLQDSMALCYGRPDLARTHLLRAARHQFLEGDVQHWWHPPSGRGVRTLFSDDYLWLPYVTAHYVQVTGDTAVLDDKSTYLRMAELAEGQEEVYDLPTVSEQKGTLYEHCVKALDRAARRGSHGLPLMGIGDWNDGMNKVGAEGKGESVWLAWFLIDTYRKFADIAEARKDDARAQDYRQQADELVRAIEQNAWDGAWYRRAYFDDGTPLGSSQNDECQIDSLPQTWGIITGAGDPERCRRAMAAVEERLVSRIDRLILLFTPPFDQGQLQPGYIKGYVPGIRENGGQYTHAAIWVALATAKLGEGRKAMELVDLLNPVHLCDTTDRVNRYKVEPYVIAADVYGRAPHIGRGGWTWYTGSASWYYRVILEAVLGFQLEGKKLSIQPCVPPDWKNFEIVYRRGKAKFVITVDNPVGVETGVKAVTLDGVAVDVRGFELPEDEREHAVKVVMGKNISGQ